MSKLLDDALKDQMYWIREKDGTLKQCDVITWSKWFEDSDNRVIKKTQLKIPGAITSLAYPPDRIIEVSTVFLGMSHGTGPTGKPLLFETMVFMDEDAGSSGEDQRRYEDEESALGGHYEIEEEFKRPRHKRDGSEMRVMLGGKEMKPMKNPVSTVETLGEEPDSKAAREKFLEALKIL